MNSLKYKPLGAAFAHWLDERDGSRHGALVPFGQVHVAAIPQTLRTAVLECRDDPEVNSPEHWMTMAVFDGVRHGEAYGISAIAPANAAALAVRFKCSFIRLEERAGGHQFIAPLKPAPDYEAFKAAVRVSFSGTLIELL